MLNEAARCLDEGIIANERDGDIGAIFGIGFPPFLGGPFTYMNKMGIENLCSQLATFANDNSVFTPAECLVPAETAKPELEVIAEAEQVIETPTEEVKTEEVNVEAEPEAVKADESSADDNLRRQKSQLNNKITKLYKQLFPYIVLNLKASSDAFFRIIKGR